MGGYHILTRSPEQKVNEVRKEIMRKFAREAITKYPSFARINEAIAGSRRKGSEITVEHYITAATKFANYLGFSDPELALKAIKDGKVNAGEKVDAFIDYALDDLGKSHSTVLNYIHGVKKWFELGDIKVDWKQIEMPTATETVENDRAPTKEELKALLNHAVRARDRFAIYALSSSGLRLGTLLSLKIGDVDFSPPDMAIIKVEKARGRKFGLKRSASSGKLYYTFMTVEAKTAMQQYLTEREAHGEILTANSPLVSDYNHKGQFVTLEAYEKVWYRILKKAGLDQRGHRCYELHLHTLRKYFRSNCIGVDPSYRERWMGHKGLYLDESYFRAEQAQNMTEYRKAIPHLSLYVSEGDEKKRRDEIALTTMKVLGYSDDKLKQFEEIMARSKDLDEALNEIRKLEDKTGSAKTATATTPKHIIASGKSELLAHLDEGYKMLQTLEPNQCLLERL